MANSDRLTMTASMVRALCYADVFEYPLTRQEMEKYQIANSKYQNDISKIKKMNEYRLHSKDDYYFLSGREELISVKGQRIIYSQNKLMIARKIAGYLKLIPTIQMVAVTGALAMRNAKRDDDIDFLIVTKSGTVWTTRLLSIVITELLGVRRRPNDTTFSDKVCLNMFIDENHMEIPKHEQDLFSAHEVVQVKVLWSKEGIAERFFGRK
ncbi:hypothetical protein HY468_02525 [Candidatus Roizmanbacteria bacterium]|nr:hypothetical protein [Candidatus Roizmanbacteria bacterium]